MASKTHEFALGDFTTSRYTDGSVVLNAPSSNANPQISLGSSRIDDLQLLATSRWTGATAPQLFSAWQFATPTDIVNGTSVTGIQASFGTIGFISTNQPQYLQFTAQMPHTWDSSKPISPHLHWMPSQDMSSSSTQIALMQFSWNVREITIAPNTGYTTYDATSANNFSSIIGLGSNLVRSDYDVLHETNPTMTKTKYQHYLTNFGSGTVDFGTHYPMSSIFCGTLTRLPNTPDYPGTIYVIGLDAHIYKKNVEGDGGPV